MISTCLQHTPPFVKIGGSVVCSHDLISRHMRQLELDRVNVPSKFVENGRGSRPESVAHYLPVLVAHDMQGVVYGVLAHRGALSIAAVRWEDKLPAPGQWLHRLQDVQCLGRQRPIFAIDCKAKWQRSAGMATSYSVLK